MDFTRDILTLLKRKSAFNISFTILKKRNIHCCQVKVKAYYLGSPTPFFNKAYAYNDPVSPCFYYDILEDYIHPLLNLSDRFAHQKNIKGNVISTGQSWDISTCSWTLSVAQTAKHKAITC